MITGRKSRLLLLAAVLLPLAGCGAEPAPSMSEVRSARPGYTMSCPPPPPPDSTYKGMICAEVPEKCSPQPCGGVPGHTLYVTGFEEWAAPDGGPGYRFGWKFSRVSGRPFRMGPVSLLGRDGSSILRYVGPGPEGCSNGKGLITIPANGTTVSPAPLCFRTVAGKKPATVRFHFFVGEVSDGVQTAIEIPLTGDGP
ncbi:hypothetical protein [Actinomadura algeriensis]|uniref:Uncharacterized protein n=1 Tax=Actinomadura algeriensis TaxID=1679523 RepID=A0ABR9JNZ0_9ACTN|nr:hypothetical protein [Actinomadura algeriensis]MBE1532282.1 hypothetical protein [Actinomadura algeriensis]